MASVLVPVAYIIIVFGGLFIFSYYYRKHTSSQASEPYFPPHPERNTYITLLQKQPPVSDALIKAALVRRAMADVQKVLRIREDKPALQNLLQKGSVGDDLWNSLISSEKELEVEIMDVMTEANTFAEGWGSVIFPTANEMLANEKVRAVWETVNDIKAELEIKYDVKAKMRLEPVPPPSSAPAKTTSGLKTPGGESAASSDVETPSKATKKQTKRK